MADFSQYLKTLVSVFVLVSPISALPVFISFTAAMTEAERNRTALRAAIAVAVTLLTAALVGKQLLGFFGISIPSFRVGGGIIVMLIAIDMINARQSRSRHTPEEGAEAGARSEIAVVPLAVPLMSGPGSISAVILYAQTSAGGIGVAPLIPIIILVAVSVFVLLRLAVPIGQRFGHTGINILSRLMGLVLAAIAVEFMASGVRDLLPALAR